MLLPQAAEIARLKEFMHVHDDRGRATMVEDGLIGFSCVVHC